MSNAAAQISFDSDPFMLTGGIMASDVTRLGEVIATRRLYMVNDKARTILVTIGRPQPVPNAPTFRCPYQVTGMGRDGIRYGEGVDEVHALQSVMKMIGADLHAFNAKHGHGLRWTEDDDPEIGFPSPF